MFILSYSYQCGVTYIFIAKVHHKHVSVVDGLSTSACSISPAWRSLQLQRKRGVGLQIVQIIWRTQLHVAIAFKHHRDSNLEKIMKNENQTRQGKIRDMLASLALGYALTARELTLLAASRASSMRFLIFLMFSEMLLMGENWEVRSSTSEILSLRDGMVFSKSFTGSRRWEKERKLICVKKKWSILFYYSH